MNLYYIIFIIIITIYIYCYFIFPNSILILQTDITDFNFNNLYLRQPIVLNDILQETNKLIDLWFNYNFIYSNITYTNNWTQNKYKYLFINANEDTEIIIYKASCVNEIPKETDNIIAIKLKKNQSVILPFYWKYYIKNNVELYGIHDIITFFLSLFV